MASFLESFPHRDSTGSQSLSDPVAASVVPWSEVGRKERPSFLATEKWQEKVRIYDRDGPGIVGATLDVPYATSKLLDLCIRKRTATGYEIVKDDPNLLALLWMWRGEAMEQKELFARLVRSLDAVGECYMAIQNADTPGRISWKVVQTTQVQDNRDGTATIRSRPEARDGDKGFTRIDDKWLYHAMVPEPEWDGVPWSPMRRGIPHIENYRKAIRNLGRGLESQLVMNGIVWAKSGVTEAQWPNNMKAWGKRAISSDDTVEAFLPYMMEGPEEPKYLEIGRKDHADQIEVARHFLKDFADSQDLPSQLIIEGVGSSNHWNAFLQSDYTADVVMPSRWQRAVSAITNSHLRGLMANLPDMFGTYNVNDYEVWVDDHRIRAKTDNSDRIFEAFKLGAIDRAPLLTAAGIDETALMPLPPGVSEYEHWLASQGQTPAPDPGAVDGVPSGDDPGMPDIDDSIDRVLAAEVVGTATEMTRRLADRRPESYWEALV